MFGWKRVRVVLIACVSISVVSWLHAGALLPSLLRLGMVGALELAVFGLLERWPARLPAWMARWALQVVAVAVVIPFALALAYWLTSFGDTQAWFHDPARMKRYALQCVLGLLSAPWIAISALLRQIKDEARNQALAFELERSEFERQVVDARLRLLQAQVEPHFLFNTLANVRELVDSGSAQASRMLGSLISYLRAAVPRLQEQSNTLEQEFELVRAYLEVMQMRMEDRLEFTLTCVPEAAHLRCPPMMVLALVENAVRHGIDPSVQGGGIAVRATVRSSVCRVEVADSGVGLRHANDGLGTGLPSLRERLALSFGEHARLEVKAREPRGVIATIEFPTSSRASAHSADPPKAH